jgi:hypothetical protein
MPRVITAIIGAFGWIGYLAVTNPAAIHWGDLHWWHGSDEPEIVALTCNCIAASALTFNICTLFGGPRMFWPCFALGLVGVWLYSRGLVPTIRDLHYWYVEATPVNGRLSLLWVTLGTCILIITSTFGWAFHCFHYWRYARPHPAMERTADRCARHF